jgi:hypothetical protein
MLGGIGATEGTPKNLGLAALASWRLNLSLPMVVTTLGYVVGTRGDEQDVAEGGAFGGAVFLTAEAELAEERLEVGDRSVVTAGATAVQTETFAEPLAEARQGAARAWGGVQFAQQDALGDERAHAPQEFVLLWIRQIVQYVE